MDSDKNKHLPKVITECLSTLRYLLGQIKEKERNNDEDSVLCSSQEKKNSDSNQLKQVDEKEDEEEESSPVRKFGDGMLEDKTQIRQEEPIRLAKIEANQEPQKE